jgi:FMN-dependent NADH-azoreductase
MTTLLVLNASPRRERSLSRRLGQAFETQWQHLRPHDAILRRDVGIQHPPLLTEAWIAACFTPDEQQTAAQREVLAYSDQAIEELARADVIVIATPRYNYGMPAALKAWFDQVIRIRRTFSFDRSDKTWPLSPLLSGKKLVLLSSSGEFGFHQGGLREDWEHLEAHVRTCARYLGVAAEDLHHVAIEYQEFADERHDESVHLALAAASALATRLVREAGTSAEAAAANIARSCHNPQGRAV